MDDKKFWEIIDAIKDSSDKREKLRELLSKQEVMNIVNFDRYFSHFRDELYGVGLWEELDKKNIWASDDGFYYFTAWVTSRGKAFYGEMIKKPSNIGNYLPSGGFAPSEEVLGYVARKIGEEKIERINSGLEEDNSVRLLGLFEEIDYDALYKKEKHFL